MKVHVGGNIFDCSDFESARRLAGWFREELEAHFMCARCQKTAAIPLSQIERMPPGSRVFDASDPDAELGEWWHYTEAQPGWPHTGWICDPCWAKWLEVVIPDGQ